MKAAGVQKTIDHVDCACCLYCFDCYIKFSLNKQSLLRLAASDSANSDAISYTFRKILKVTLILLDKWN